ncbi:MAG: chaperone modulator CbpM [Ancalomicrobiaceae bacterium]|nr:chaperone modulator CbpM [Ancalomicrobiaceae bacterium]
MISIDLVVDATDGLSRPDLDRWIENDWIRPDLDDGIYVFHDIDVARVRLIQELRDELGVGEEALPIVLLLLDQLYELRRQMRRLQPRSHGDSFGPFPTDTPPIDLRAVSLMPNGRCPDCQWPHRA